MRFFLVFRPARPRAGLVAAKHDPSTLKRGHQTREPALLRISMHALSEWKARTR